jgi:hypothetical protein
LNPTYAHDDFDHSLEEVTPALAEEWLKNPFDKQRTPRDHHVILLWEEMENGTFFPHSTIAFAELDGKRYLIDGQHRLMAVSAYGKPVKMLVMTKKATSMKQIQEWYASIDQGLRRTAYDAIKAQGLSSEPKMTGSERMIRKSGF